jgi:hypothetical protein
MNRDCQTNPVALLVFDTMITTGQLVASVRKCFERATSQHQIEDPKSLAVHPGNREGVLTELHKI